MQAAVSRRRETLADVSGVELTRYPPGLISALEKLRDDYTVVGSTSHATAHLWIEQPRRWRRTRAGSPGSTACSTPIRRSRSASRSCESSRPIRERTTTVLDTMKQRIIAGAHGGRRAPRGVAAGLQRRR